MTDRKYTDGAGWMIAFIVSAMFWLLVGASCGLL